MPELRGKPLRHALTILAALRTDVRLVGTGTVVQQVPAAGEPIAEGAAVRLTLVRFPRPESRPAASAPEAASPRVQITPTPAIAVPALPVVKTGSTE